MARQSSASHVVPAALAALLVLALPAPGQEEQEDRFIALSEFQVWADAAGPEVARELSRMYNETGSSHVFRLYPRYELFVWDTKRMRAWVDEAERLGCFNLFTLGDDIRTAQGHLFDSDGVNPELRDVLFQTIAHAHERGFLAGVEPTHLPPIRDRASFVPWLASWLGDAVPPECRADVVKLSIEWFGAWQLNPEIAVEVEAFFEALREVSPGTLVYVDSISGTWRRPQPFHRWLLHRHPGTILSHYLGTDQVAALRAMGARNLMVQVNPSEVSGPGGQFFVYHDVTVRQLQEAVAARVRFLSLAGVNHGYSRYNYDLFLDVVRPHLRLVRSLEELRGALRKDAVPSAPSAEEVAQALVELAREHAEEEIQAEAPPPRNAAGRPACFGDTPDGWVRRLAALADGMSGEKFEGAYTEPLRRRPVRATFGRDLGAEKRIRRIVVVPCLAEDDPAYVAGQLRVEVRTGGGWSVLPGAAWDDNDRRRIVLTPSPPVLADAVRVVVLTETDDGRGNYRACCQEIEVELED